MRTKKFKRRDKSWTKTDEVIIQYGIISEPTHPITIKLTCLPNIETRRRLSGLCQLSRERAPTGNKNRRGDEGRKKGGEGDENDGVTLKAIEQVSNR